MFNRNKINETMHEGKILNSDGNSAYTMLKFKLGLTKIKYWKRNMEKFTLENGASKLILRTY